MGIFFGRKANQSYDAYHNNTNPSWWKDPGLRLSVFTIMTACAIQASAGVDKSLNTVQQSLPAWKAIMGNPTSQSLGLITTSMYIAGFVFALPSQQVMDRWGRKTALTIGMLILAVGTAIETAAVNKGMFIAGRVIIGAGLAFSTTVAPVMAQELAHPRMRGTVATMFNTVYFVGAIFVSWVGFGCSYLSSSWSWRIPTLMQIVPVIYISLTIPWIPESPRWLMANGKEADALKMLAKYHANGDETDELVLFELAEMKEALARDGKAAAISWREAFNTPGNRKRFLMITCVSVFSNWNGQNIVSYYLAQMLNLVGITGSTKQTAINGGLQIVNWLTSMLGASLAESAGRRPLWLASFGVMFIANIILTTTTGEYFHSPTAGLAGGVIFAVFLYDVGYNIACTPLLYAYETEIMPFHLRAKGMAYSVTIGQLQAIVFQYCNPIGLANLSWKYYLIFTGFLVIEILGVYFFFVETSGRTLEEVAALFDGEGASEHIQMAAAQAEEKAEERSIQNDRVAGRVQDDKVAGTETHVLKV